VGEEAAQVFGLSVYRYHTHKRSNGTFVCFFFVLFLSNKEKGHRSSFMKGERGLLRSQTGEGSKFY